MRAAPLTDNAKASRDASPTVPLNFNMPTPIASNGVHPISPSEPKAWLVNRLPSTEGRRLLTRFSRMTSGRCRASHEVIKLNLLIVITASDSCFSKLL